MIPSLTEEQADTLRCLLELVLRSPGRYAADFTRRTRADSAGGGDARLDTLPVQDEASAGGGPAQDHP